MMFFVQSTPDFCVAEHYGLRNTTCLYSKDVAYGGVLINVTPESLKYIVAWILVRENLPVWTKVLLNENLTIAESKNENSLKVNFLSIETNGFQFGF
jgi:hypothetical protein